jgi:hypothetical protein
MDKSIFDKVIEAFREAENHNSHLMVKPEVILWPDPDSQWADVIDILQSKVPQLLVYGSYDAAKKQGPAIWIKCMIAKVLPEADWVDTVVPIIYLPGVSKVDLRSVENAVFDFQPLLEYQYTGSLFLQENGREWTIMAFLENPIYGMGVKVAKDNATKDSLKKTLRSYFHDEEIFRSKTYIDADFLNNLSLPNISHSILSWMCDADGFMQTLDSGQKEIFADICKSQYDFDLDPKNIKAIAEKLGAQKSTWKNVWQHFISIPHKYPEIEVLLRLAKPEDLGSGMFALPEESWPQVNEQNEEYLSNAFTKIGKQYISNGFSILQELEKSNAHKRNWVWFNIGKAPLTDALQHLTAMANLTMDTYASGSIDELVKYYTTQGYQVDQAMRKALGAVKTERDKTSVVSVIKLFYTPWLEKITKKFQGLVAKDSGFFTPKSTLVSTDEYILFVDALRFELAEDFASRFRQMKWKVYLDCTWSAIPSLTPTAKPAVSPIASEVSDRSGIVEFRPFLRNGKELSTAVFRDTLRDKGIGFVTKPEDIHADSFHWQEIGDIDEKGHNEQSGIVRRIDELFDQVKDALEKAFEKGVKRIKIVTDHGWLLLPGGLPKKSLHTGLTETRWGRCALIKEGAKTDLLHLPWRWNPHTYIAYAPDICFFKANVEYAHGGISIHECLVPVMSIENPYAKKVVGVLKNIKWTNLKCNIQTSEVPDGYSVDIRTKFNDESTSIVLSKNRSVKDCTVSLMVEDAVEYQAAAVVLLDENGRILDKKATTVGGD